MAPFFWTSTSPTASRGEQPPRSPLTLPHPTPPVDLSLTSSPAAYPSYTPKAGNNRLPTPCLHIPMSRCKGTNSFSPRCQASSLPGKGLRSCLEAGPSGVTRAEGQGFPHTHAGVSPPLNCLCLQPVWKLLI